MNSTEQPSVGAPVEASVRPLVERLRNAAVRYGNETQHEATIRRNKTIAEAADEIERLRATLAKAEHWAQHVMLMRSTQNAELLRILRGEA